MADDDELAAQMPEPKGTSSPPINEWSTTNELLAQIVDRLGEQTAVMVGLQTRKKSKPPKPVRRPTTARERIKTHNRLANHRRIVDMVRPREGRPTMADGSGMDAKHTMVRRRGS